MKKFTKLIVGSVMGLFFIISCFFVGVKEVNANPNLSYNRIIMLGESFTHVVVEDVTYYKITCNYLADFNLSDNSITSIAYSDVSNLVDFYFIYNPYNICNSNDIILIKNIYDNVLNKNFVSNFCLFQSFIENQLSNNYDLGFNDGKLEGYDEGYNVGNTDGIAIGDSQGYSRGFNDGKSEGHDEGYLHGYDVGLSDGQLSSGSTFANFINLLRAIFLFPIDFFVTGLDVSVFGIHIGDFFLGVFMFVLMLGIIDKIRGVK